MRKLSILLIILFISYTAFSQQNPNGLPLQSNAPAIETTDHSGKKISLAEMTKSGPVVLVFYRGYWCPYCSKQLKELQDSLGLIKQRSASVIAITAEADAGIDKTVKKSAAEFPVIYDKDLMISKAYQVAYEVDSATVNKYKSKWGVDFLEINQQKNNAWLPVPAVYIVDKKGMIVYRFVEQDIRKRASVKEILDQLDK